MPVTIKQGLMKYKNEQGEYVGINTVGETTTAELLDSINAAGATQLSNVNQAGTTQTQAVNSAGATQTNAVNTAGTTQTQAVNSAGSAQVQAINTAGANQLSAINTKGQEVLDSIPSEYSELDGEVRDLNRAFNNLPTEETGQELLKLEGNNAGLTETALAVIGWIFSHQPQDDAAVDIANSLSLECERLQAIYDNWISERGA